MPRLDVWDAAPVSKVVSYDCGFARRPIEERYRVGKELGQGGFGAVRVVSDDHGKEYACKVSWHSVSMMHFSPYRHIISCMQSIAKVLDVPNVSQSQIQRHLDNIKREVAVLRKLRGTVRLRLSSSASS